VAGARARQVDADINRPARECKEIVDLPLHFSSRDV